MKHIYQKGSTEKTLLLLHGTGGDEYDLLEVGNKIDATANILSVRGNVTENGMNRFFKRLAMGVFDEEDLIKQTHALYEFIIESSIKYQFDRKQLTVVGYSNGANIASSVLFHLGPVFSKAILFHPMVPRRGIKLPRLEGVQVFIGAGSNDPICSSEESIELSKQLENASAKVELYWSHMGHRLNSSELDAARIWYEKTLTQS